MFKLVSSWVNFELNIWLHCFRDGTRVSDLMNQVLSTYWDTANPKATGGQCVALKNMKLVNVPCDNSVPTYFDVNLGQLTSLQDIGQLQLSNEMGPKNGLIFSV